MGAARWRAGAGLLLLRRRRTFAPNSTSVRIAGSRSSDISIAEIDSTSSSASSRRSSRASSPRISPVSRSELNPLLGSCPHSTGFPPFAVHAKVEALTERLTEGGALAPERAEEILGITAADVVASKASGKKSPQSFLLGDRLIPSSSIYSCCFSFS